MADIETTTDKEKSLFIIEDDKPFRERLTTSFQRKDFTVTAAANKKEALEILTGSDFNYAIVDLRLGDGSGLDVIKVIKEKNPECRTVMLTSYGNIATAVSSVKLGADDYLTKTANIDDIEKLNFELKGELTIVISNIKLDKKNSQSLSESDKRNIAKMINKLSTREITNFIGQNSKVSKKEIYDYCLKLKNEK